MTIRVGILADDLTSAADAAAPFRAAGLAARVQLRAGVRLGDGDVVSLDADSRRLDPVAAATTAAQGTRALAGAATLIKTVDSTLLGNVTSEVPVALAASGRRTAIVAPAFPAEGRTTAHGVQLLHGVPVDRTAYGADFSHPARCADLIALLPTASKWSREAPLPPGVVVVDACLDGDLDALVAAVPDDRDVMWVGSPGLAAALARRLPRAADGAAQRVPQAARTLVVVGSRNSVSRLQLSRLVSPTQVLDAGAGAPAAIAESLAGSLSEHGLAGLLDGSCNSAPQQIAERLSGIVQALRDGGCFDALFVAGGATARALLDRLDVADLELIGEPEPGIVTARTGGPSPFLLVLKAGGFGDADTFLRLHSLLTPALDRQDTA